MEERKYTFYDRYQKVKQRTGECPEQNFNVKTHCNLSGNTMCLLLYITLFHNLPVFPVLFQYKVKL